MASFRRLRLRGRIPSGPILLHRLLRILCRLAAAAPPAVAVTAAAPDLGHIHECSDTESECSLVSEEYNPFADYPAPQQ